MSKPTTNALGQPIRPATPADKARAAAWAPFLAPLPEKLPKPAPSIWTRPLPATKGTGR